MIKELLLSALVALGILLLYSWLWWIRKGIYLSQFNQYLIAESLKNRRLILFQRGVISALSLLLRSQWGKRRVWSHLVGFFLLLLSLQLLLSMSLYLLFDYQLQWQDHLFLLLLVPLILFDLRYYLIPDPLLYPLLWGGICLALFHLGAIDLESSLLGVMGGYLLFEVCYWSGVLFVRREIMGRGDIKLFAALLAWLGVQSLPILLLLSALLGLGSALSIRLRYSLLRRVSGELSEERKQVAQEKVEGKMIPFAPALGFSGIILYFNLQIFGN